VLAPLLSVLSEGMSCRVTIMNGRDSICVCVASGM